MLGSFAVGETWGVFAALNYLAMLNNTPLCSENIS